MCRKVADFVACAMLYPVLACTVIQCAVMEKVWEYLTQLYIRKVFDQIEGPVKKVFKLWDGSIAVEMRVYQWNRKLCKVKLLGSCAEVVQIHHTLS